VCSAFDAAFAKLLWLLVKGSDYRRDHCVSWFWYYRLGGDGNVVCSVVFISLAKELIDISWCLISRYRMISTRQHNRVPRHCGATWFSSVYYWFLECILCRCGAPCVSSKMSTLTLISAGFHALDHGNKHLCGYQAVGVWDHPQRRWPLQCRTLRKRVFSDIINSRHVSLFCKLLSLHLADWWY